MKIGILTYHRSHNYGALLQAVALRNVLQSLHHEVYYIDYWPNYHRHIYELFSFRSMIKRGTRNGFKYFLECMKYYSIRKRRIDSFKIFIKLYIEPYCASMNSSFDLVIHGSDQIWRKQPEIKTYNSIYFGEHKILTKRKVSYAASMGILPENVGEKELLKKYLYNLDYISVRENNLKKNILGLGFQNVRIDIDPTLLLTGESWKKMFGLEEDIAKEKYVLFYDLMSESFMRSEIVNFAKNRAIGLKTIYGKAKKIDGENEITKADPISFLRLIMLSDFVFTSSFHGLVFAILFKKPFYASFRINSGRAQSLLQELGLLDYLLTPHSKIPSDYHPINFSTIMLKLDQLRKSSMRYLIDITQ